MLRKVRIWRMLRQAAHENVQSFQEPHARVIDAIELAAVNEQRVYLIRYTRVEVHASLVEIWIANISRISRRGRIFEAARIVHVTQT